MPSRMGHGGQTNISILGVNTNGEEDFQEGREKIDKERTQAPLGKQI